jgi:Uma2 family endonuclease
MNQPLSPQLPGPVIYPESDGKPMADNSIQFRWIVVIYGNLAAQYREDVDVWVNGDMFWYPVEGHPEIVMAPDVFVVFGRPKGDRGSYRQWEEGNIPLTVFFEIRSPVNTDTEMDNKLLFYEEHGVEEYYVYDPDKNRLSIYVRRGTTLVRVRPVEGFVSPRLGIRFMLSEADMVVTGPNGQSFLTFEQLQEARQQAEHRAQLARQQAVQLEQQVVQAQQQAAQAQQQMVQAQQQADQARQQATQAQQTAAQAQQQAAQAQQRAARLVELNRKARRQQATAEELAELERLEEEAGPTA